MIQKTRKKKWALLLAVCMLFSMMPTSVFATVTDTATVDFRTKQDKLTFTDATDPVKGLLVEAVADITSGTSATGKFTFSLGGNAADKFELVNPTGTDYTLVSPSATSASATASVYVKVANSATLMNGETANVTVTTTVNGVAGATMVVDIVANITGTGATTSTVTALTLKTAAPAFTVGNTSTTTLAKEVTMEAKLSGTAPVDDEVTFTLADTKNKFVLHTTDGVEKTSPLHVTLTGSSTTATVYVAIQNGKTLELGDDATITVASKNSPAVTSSPVTIKVNPTDIGTGTSNSKIDSLTSSSAPIFTVGNTSNVTARAVTVTATSKDPAILQEKINFRLGNAMDSKFVLRSGLTTTEQAYELPVQLSGSATAGATTAESTYTATATVYVAVKNNISLVMGNNDSITATPVLSATNVTNPKITVSVVPRDDSGSSGSGSGSGGSTTTPTTTTPTTASQATIDAAIKNGSNVVLAVTASAPSVSITNSQIANILKAGIDLVIKNSHVEFKLDKELLNSTGLSDAKNVTIALTPATVGKSTADKLEKMDAKNKDLMAATAFDITIKADGKAVTTFSKPLELKFSLSGLNLTAAQISKLTGVRFTDMSKGKFNQLGGKYDEKTKSVTMKTSKLSTYGTMISDNLVSLKLAINKPAYTVNGKSGQFEVAPTLINDRTMVPVRAITEMFGAKVTWVPDGKIVKIELDGKETSLVINQKAPGMDTPAIIVNDRTLVPLGYIADQFESNVIWTDATKSLEIYR